MASKIVIDRRSIKDRRRYKDTGYPAADRRERFDRRSGSARRKHNRYKAKDNVFVEFKVSPIKIGRLLDISKSGLSSQYIGGDEELSESSKLKIYIFGNGFTLDHLSFMKISDFQLKKEFPYSITNYRRCGVQFEELTQSQASMIDHFIKTYTD